ncbi:MAG TPA: phage tail tube protein [Chloroflexia bacterium]|nr:phage tail tube protein [Chloroflexia bacterium]
MSAGIQSLISIAKESNWGTPVTPSKSIPVRPTGGITIKNNIQMLPALKGGLQKYYDAIKGKVAYEGEYTFDAFADLVGYFLLSALGSDTPAAHGSESTVYDHVFSESATKTSLTIEQGQGENCRRYAGALVSGFKLSGKVGEMLEFTPSILAKTQASSTQISASFSNVPAFNHANLAVKIGGSTIGEVEKFELEYKNGLEMVYALGNNEPSYYSIQNGSEVTIKMDLYLDTTTLTRLTNYINKTTESIELIATGVDTIGNASHYVLDMLIPKAIYTAGETKITDSHNLLTIEANGIYDTATSKLLTPTLTNLVASY